MEQTSRMNKYVENSLATREKYRKELLDIIRMRFWHIFTSKKANRVSIDNFVPELYTNYSGVAPEIKEAYRADNGELLLDVKLSHQVIKGILPKTLGTEILEMLAHNRINSGQNMDNGDVFFFDNNEFVNPKIEKEMKIEEGPFNLRREIMRMYNEHVEMNGSEPTYACCEIQFKGEGSLMENIKLSCDCDEGSEEDNETFFYCNGVDELCAMIEEGVEDWVLLDVYSFE